MIKVYYKLDLTLLSPLSIGSGVGVVTDSDVAVNSQGKPYIPASAIAGKIRNRFQSVYSDTDADDIFGFIKINKGNANFDKIAEKSKKSRMYFYDAVFEGCTDDYISIRDGVALDEKKIAVEGAKYDFEVVETGQKAVTFIEYDAENESAVSKLDMVLSGIKTFSMGAKSTRGYGKISAEIRKRSFNFSLPERIEEWLEFDLFNKAAFDDCDALGVCEESEYENKLVVELEAAGSFLVRRYTTEVISTDNSKPNPDYKQLSLHDETAVIPGTSWAGAFKSRMKKIGSAMKIPAEELDDMISNTFGFVSDKSASRSKIRFSETKFTDTQSKIITRTAIDRFTGGASDKSLFTSQVPYGGKTTLTIEYANIGEAEKLLLYSLADLNFGIMSVGGETSIGRGIFRVASAFLNGREVSITESGVFVGKKEDV